MFTMRQIVDTTLLTLFQISPGFYVCAAKVFLETLLEKEKLLVTSNYFSFSHSVFYPLGQFPAIFINLKLGRVLNLSFGKWLKALQMKKSECYSFGFDRIGNIVGRGGNSGNHRFLLFPKCFHLAFSSGSRKP